MQLAGQDVCLTLVDLCFCFFCAYSAFSFSFFSPSIGDLTFFTFSVEHVEPNGGILSDWGLQQRNVTEFKGPQ
jgi:hypothetical protein